MIAPGPNNLLSILMYQGIEQANQAIENRSNSETPVTCFQIR